MYRESTDDYSGRYSSNVSLLYTVFTLRSRQAMYVCITKHWGAFVQPLLLWKNNDYYIFWVCICGLSYPACNAYAPHCHLWLDPLYNFFPHCLRNGTIFEKKITDIKRVFRVSLQLLSAMFFILRRTERDMRENLYWSSRKVSFILVWY
jgi:hypothetical protein